MNRLRTAPRVVAICRLKPRARDLLPHWREHYRALGAEEIILAEDQSPCPPIDGWIIDAGVEEFHEYPAPLPHIIAAAQARGVGIISGHVVDRVARDGAMPQLLAEPSIWEQFPYACRLSELIWPARVPKPMLYRSGHERDRAGGVPIGRKDQYRIHQFCWYGDCLAALESELDDPQSGLALRMKIGWYFSSLQRHRARINLLHPMLQAVQTWNPSRAGPLPAAAKQPGIGNRVVLLHCDSTTRNQLRAAGWEGDCTVGQDGVDVFLRSWKTGESLDLWLDAVRNEAAIAGHIATIWMPDMPEELQAALRNALGGERVEVIASDAADAHRQIQSRELPARARKVFAICAIRDGGADLLPHWLEHYLALGADHLVLATISPTDACAERTIAQCRGRWRFTRTIMPPEANLELDQDELRRTVLRRAGARRGDWILHTDLDEFHEFPAPLDQIIAAAEAGGIDAIPGKFLDRVSADGSLKEVSAWPSIWRQFPVGCRFSEAIYRKNAPKVMLARFEVRTTAGHHGASNSRRVAIPLGRADQHRVHHFRWHGQAVSRLKWVMSLEDYDPHWKRETTRVLEWLDRHGGKINVNDPTLESRLCPSPFEPRVRIFGLARVGNENVQWLGHWLEHHGGLGVDRLLVAVSQPLDAVAEETIRHAARKWDFERVIAGDQSTDDLLKKAGATCDDWVIDAQLHELLEFPAPLATIIARAAAKGISGVYGRCVDHIAAEGILPHVLPSPSLFEQFPLTCVLSERVFGPPGPQLTLHRFGANCRPGPAPLGRPEQYLSHGFHWTGDRVAELKQMLLLPQTSQTLKHRLKWFFEMLSRNCGRIHLVDPWMKVGFTRSAHRPPSPPKLPYIGDKLILLYCDATVREELRARGLQGDSAVGHDGVDVFLTGLMSLPPERWAAELTPWLQRLRNEAAVASAIAAVWMPSMPASLAAAIGQVVGEDLLELHAESTPDALRQIEAHSRPRPRGGQTIFAICTIRNGSVELLPHWLEHYSSLGADRLLVAVVEPIERQFDDQIKEMARRWKFERFPASAWMAFEGAMDELHGTVLRQAGAQPDDWIIHTDLDELHEFPAPLRQVIAAAEKRGIDTLYGNFLDRVTADGSLSQLQPVPSIWEQFPIGCQITKNIAKGLTQKLMLAKYQVHIGGGHHAAINGKLTAPIIGRADQYIVHHFKWRGELVERLRWAMTTPGVCPVWVGEANRLIEWIDSNGGKLNLADPRMESQQRWHPAPFDLQGLQPKFQLPSIGNKVVLARCDAQAWGELQAMGLVTDATHFLDQLPTGEKVGHEQLTSLIAPWLAALRNRAAMSGATCGVWTANLPAAAGNAIAHVAGADRLEIGAVGLAQAVAEIQAHAIPERGVDSIYVVGTMQCDQADLLGHWLEHYSRLGADRILLVYQPDARLKHAIEECGERWQFQAFGLASPPVPGDQQDEIHRTLLRRAGAGAQSWIIHANVHELHEYPAPLKTLVAAAREQGIDAVFGQIIDHVAADGSLPPAQDSPSLWEQFPIGCRLFSGVGGGMSPRLMLARFSVMARHGHQTADCEKPQITPIDRPEHYAVHQFNWRRPEIGAMVNLKSQADVEPYWKTLFSRILPWLAANGWKANLADVAMDAHEVWHPTRADAPAWPPARLPYIGDKVVLLNCGEAIYQSLLIRGLHHVVDLSRATGNIDHWLERIRNEAARCGEICGLRLPEISAPAAAAIRNAAGEDILEITGTELTPVCRQIETHAAPMSPMDGKIMACCIVGKGEQSLLPHWLAHYTALGVDQIVLAVSQPPDAEAARVLEECGSRWRLAVYPVPESACWSENRQELKRTLLRKAGAVPGAWVIHSEIHWMLEFPASLQEIIAAAGKSGGKAIFGKLLDRVASDGVLRPVLPTPELWEQFPIGCRLTEAITRVVSHHVMLSRYEVPVDLARHVASNAGLGAAPVGNPHDYVIHQFKWHADWAARVQMELARPNVERTWAQEIRNTLAWLRVNGGKVNLKLPILQAKTQLPPRRVAS